MLALKVLGRKVKRQVLVYGSFLMLGAVAELQEICRTPVDNQSLFIGFVGVE